MDKRILLISNAAFLGFTGVVLTFLPEEISTYLGVEYSSLTTLIFLVMGALYLGFAMLNWMTKDAQIRGIYNKPFVTSNLVHYGIGALALLKLSFSVQLNKEVIYILAFFYIAFAIGFLYTFLVNPEKQQTE